MKPSVRFYEVDSLLRLDLASFIGRAFMELHPGATLAMNWHIPLIADRLMAVARGDIKRLIINIPPRNLKSICASVAFPAWLLGNHPEKRIICASYAQELALKLASDSKAVMSADWYERAFPEMKFSSRTAVHDFVTTMNGGRLAVSTGGGITGRGADILIIDDPLKPDEAPSEKLRTAANSWLDQTARSRLNDKKNGAIVIIMQRLHMDDMVGHVLVTDENWEVLSLPAIAETNETHAWNDAFGGTYEASRIAGEALHPERESVETLMALRNTMTEYAYFAQYQQQPVPEGGFLIKEHWLHYYQKTDLPTKFDWIVQSWDTASKPTDTADYSVGITFGMYRQQIYVLDVVRVKEDFPTLKQTIVREKHRYTPHQILIEEAASGIGLIQELKNAGIYQVIGIKPDKDKQSRLLGVTPMLESGKVKLPEQTIWLAEFRRELLSFPSAKHDDQVDALTQGLSHMRERLEEPGIIGYYRGQVKDLL